MKIKEMKYPLTLMCNLDPIKNKDPNYMLLIISLFSELQNFGKLLI